MATAVKQRVTPGTAGYARSKFLKFFPKGFQDEKYFAWERGYKWRAHERWEEALPRRVYRELLENGEFSEIAARALKSLSGTNLLFSFENMALRDALKSQEGAKQFAEGLFDFLYGRSAMRKRFEDWCDVVASLPKKQSRVFTHPVVTVFGFVAQPETHIFLKPNVTRTAALRYGFDLQYHSRPSSETYESLLEFGAAIRRDLAGLEPRDMIDIQSFIWALGSSEYD